MNPYALLGIVLAVGALTGGAYWQGRNDGENKIVAQQAREDAIAAKAIESAASAAAVAISQIKVQHRTVQQEVQREVLVQTQYRDPGCMHDANSLRNINAAITGKAWAEPASGVVVPRTVSVD